MIFIIDLHVYPFEVMVSLGDNEKQFKKALKKFGVEYDDDFKLTNTCKGRTVMTADNQTVLRLPCIPSTCEDFGFLQHEIFHVVEFITRKVGIKLNEGSDEAYAYLIGYLTEKIYENIQDDFK